MATAKGKTTRTAADKSIAAKSKAAAKPARPTKSTTRTAAPAASGLSLEKAAGALFGQLKGYTDMVAGGLMDVARVGSVDKF